ncbi:MAG: hypothetical protein IPN57_04175 [Ignavibacteria bacterium]|nr:hypothetical protein [Ignavibacteria bacterium]
MLIALIYGNCKTGIEKTEFETKIEYNEKNLSIKYSTENNESIEIQSVNTLINYYAI